MKIYHVVYLQANEFEDVNTFSTLKKAENYLFRRMKSIAKEEIPAWGNDILFTLKNPLDRQRIRKNKRWIWNGQELRIIIGALK